MKSPRELLAVITQAQTSRGGFYPNGTADGEGWNYTSSYANLYHHAAIRPDYLPAMAAVLEAVNPDKYLAIGVFLGTLESYASRMTKFSPRLIVAIDLDTDFYNAHRDSLAAAYKNITGEMFGNYQGELVLIRADSLKSKVPQRLGKYDLIFVDAQHTMEAMVKDIETAYSCLAKRGVILVHDINDKTANKEILKMRQGFLDWCAARVELDQVIAEDIFGSVGIVWRKNDYPEIKAVLQG